MNLLILTSRLPYPPYRGDKLKVYNLIKQLSARHRITLLTLYASNDEVRFVPELEKICASVNVIHLGAAASIANCVSNVLSGAPFQVAYFSSRPFEQKLDATLAKEKFDGVYVHLISMARYAVNAKIAPDAVIDLTDAVSLYLKRFLDAEKNPFKKFFLKEEWFRVSQYERIVEGFGQSLVCSGVDRDHLLRHAPHARVGVLPNGIDLEYFNETADVAPEPHSLVYTGNMSYYPNVDGALYFTREILPRIKEKVPDVRLSIVGQNPPQKLRRLAGPGISVTGFVTDIKERYLKGEVAVAPVRYGAGTLNKVLEPMALGVPVVASSFSVEGLPLENGRDVLLADRPDEFAAHVVALLASGELRRTIGGNARAIVRHLYGWDKIAATLENYFTETSTRKNV
jgi:sugar transferase (PEP-CTERM/EpsH1 system associated)